MVRSFHVLMTTFVFGLGLLDVSSAICRRDSECPPKEVCCGGYDCRSRSRCQCVIHSQCPPGQKCVNFQCIPRKDSLEGKSCSLNSDCRNYYQLWKCCDKKCRKSCTELEFSTTQPPPDLPCIGSRECSNGEKCVHGKCAKGLSSSKKSALTKAGFLSAAILTGSLFLLIMCCCFVRESKLGRQRYVERQRRHSRRRSRNRRRSRFHHAPGAGPLFVTPDCAIDNRAFNPDTMNGDGVFFIQPPAYSGESNTNQTGNRVNVLNNGSETQVSPPPYHTLSFVELPPSYEEALRNNNAGSNSSLTQVSQ